MEVGIIALGSHRERHGAALPPDTDALIAKHMAQETAERTDAKFLETLKSSYELPEIETGEHQPLDELIEELEIALRSAKSDGFEGIVLINAHGGNQKLEGRLGEISKETQVELKMDSTICKLEGPHAGSGELSVGSVIGITDESKLEEHSDAKKHPEVGFAGLEKVREKYQWAEKHAQEVVEGGMEIDKHFGKILLQSSIASAVNRVQELESGS